MSSHSAVPTLEESADVLVIGGGTAGVVAAIQAARAGARTVLVEAMSQLGGTVSTGGVSAPSYFFAGPRQVIAGIGWELVTKTAQLERRPLPDFANPPPHRPSYPAFISHYTYALICEEEVLRAGVTLRLHECPLEAAPLPAGAGWEVVTAGKGLRRIIRCRELVDCTGGADIVGMLGYARDRGETRMPGTLSFKLDGYDPAALDAEVIEKRYRAALAEGALLPGDFYDARKPFISFLQARGANQQHVFGADSSTAAAQADADIAGRASLLRLLRFIQTLPGCEGVTLAKMCPTTAVRESCRIQGETAVTYEDYMTGRVFPDAVGYSMYFIDIHTEEGIVREFLEPGVVPTLPLGALIPRGSRRLLVAGRSISSDQRANSALRVQASCMAMGQAAGAAAALGCALGVPSREVPLPQLRALLEEHGAILPPPVATVPLAG